MVFPQHMQSVKAQTSLGKGAVWPKPVMLKLTFDSSDIDIGSRQN